MNIAGLKSLNLDRVIEIDEAIALSADIRTLQAEYDELAIERPEWLNNVANIVREEIAKRTRANDLAQLRNLEAQSESLKTVDEKRNQINDAMAALQRKLGMTAAPAGRQRKAATR